MGPLTVLKATGTGRAERWLVLQDGVARGPFDATEMALLCEAGTLQPDTLIQAEGWRTWQPCRAVLRALSIRRGERPEARDGGEPAAPAASHRLPPPPGPARRVRAPRIALPADPGIVALVHDGETLLRTRPVDVSRTGMLVSTPGEPFPVGRRVQLTLKAPGHLPSFSATAEVVRVGDEDEDGAHFALRFDEEPEALKGGAGEPS